MIPNSKLKYPYILIAKEKHSDRYFYVPSEGSLLRTCLKLLKERADFEYCMERPERPMAPDYTKEEAEKLKGPARAAALSAAKDYQRELEDFEEQNEFVTAVERACKEDDGLLAFQILFGVHNDYEYEHIELEHPEDA